MTDTSDSPVPVKGKPRTGEFYKRMAALTYDGGEPAPPESRAARRAVVHERLKFLKAVARRSR